MNHTALSYPFLRHEFLQALEDSGSACDASGWYPIHLSLQRDSGTDTNLTESKVTEPDAKNTQVREIEIAAAKSAALMPLYLKDHSMGE